MSFACYRPFPVASDILEAGNSLKLFCNMGEDSDNLGNHNPADGSRNSESDKFGCHFVAPCLFGVSHSIYMIGYVIQDSKEKKKRNLMVR